MKNIESIIYELSEENKKDILINCVNLDISPIKTCNILKTINDDQVKLNIMLNRQNSKLISMIRHQKLLSANTIINNIDIFLRLEGVKNYDKLKKYIKELYKTNNDIVFSINWKLLDEKYINTLGLEKINLIGSFELLINNLLEMDDKEYEAFYRCLNHYIKKYGKQDWDYSAYQMMQELYFNRMDRKKVTDYIEDFDTVNIDNLLYILLNGDNYGIKSLDDINQYDKLMIEKCNQIIAEGDLNKKKDAIFYKCFGLSDDQSVLRGLRKQIKNGMRRIYYLYHTDIELIEDKSIKDLFKFLETVINSKSDEELINIYNNITNFKHLDTYKFEKDLKNEFLKLYNKELLQLDSLEVNDDGLLEAGTEFSMFVHSIGAYSENNPDNFMEDWNRKSLTSAHFCTSYIRNDMLGTAPVPHFMYGFTYMEPYSLLLAGPNDIFSSVDDFISRAYENEMYYAPNNQINKTPNYKDFNYNEMDFRRVNGGKKKQPDYILVFRKDGVISNIKEAKKASSDWNNLPIVVVDVNLCLKNEKNKIQKLLANFYQNPTIDIYNNLVTKINNNRVTDSSFMNNIDIDELKNVIYNDYNYKQNRRQ